MCLLPLQYAGYCLLGLVSMVLGIVYYSEVGSEFVAVRSCHQMQTRTAAENLTNQIVADLRVRLQRQAAACFCWEASHCSVFARAAG